MKPAAFPEANRKLVAPPNSPVPCGDLPVFTDDVQCISFWALEGADVRNIIREGGIWIQLLSGATQPPIAVSTVSPFVQDQVANGREPVDMPKDSPMKIKLVDLPEVRDLIDRLATIREVVADPSALDRGVAMVAAFHQAFGHPISRRPQVPNDDRAALRVSLIMEEAAEFKAAAEAKDIVAVADALCDLLYVTFGAMLEYGVPTVCFEEVHASNMTKLGEDGKPIYREDGKSMKGPNFRPPDLKKIIDLVTQVVNEVDGASAATESTQA